MKKLLPLLLAFVLLTGCQDDDTPATLPNDYTSEILINGLSFWPSDGTGSQSYVTTQAYTDGTLTHRSFAIKRYSNNPTLSEGISLNIAYEADVNGTYIQSAAGKEFTIQGIYSMGDDFETFSNGSTITVTNLGNNKYSITFNNVTTTSVSDAPSTIRGNFTGTFTAADK